jgi:hypothetical protein
MPILSKLFSFIFREIIDGERIVIGGLVPHEEDPRDFKYGALGGLFGPYIPKQSRLQMTPLEIKNQYPNNDCVFHAYTACREQDVGTPLSPRSLVIYARQKGYLRSNGLSSVRNGQKAGVEFGLALESVMGNPNMRWQEYAYAPLTPDIEVSAAHNKAKSYFWVSGKDEWLKALDDKHPIHTGFDWYSSYNMASGFGSPWVLPWRRGYKVGGHSVACIGYDIPKNLLIFQNSFGGDWGDSGLFYVSMDRIWHEGIQGAVAVSLDSESMGTFVSSHEGKDVKATDNPVIYRVQDGKKRPYPDEITFYAGGGRFPDGDDVQTFEDVASSFISMIPDGDPMKPEESIYWPKLLTSWDEIRWMRHPDNIYAIKNLIAR